MKTFWWAMVGVIFKEKVVYGCVNSVLTGSWLVTHYSRCEKVVLYQSIVCRIDVHYVSGVQVATVHDKNASIFGK